MRSGIRRLFKRQFMPRGVWRCEGQVQINVAAAKPLEFLVFLISIVAIYLSLLSNVLLTSSRGA